MFARRHTYPMLASLFVHALVLGVGARAPWRRVVPDVVERDAWSGRTLDVEAVSVTVPRPAPAAPEPKARPVEPDSAREPSIQQAPIDLAGAASKQRGPVEQPSERRALPRTKPGTERAESSSESTERSGPSRAASRETLEFGAEGLPQGVRRFAVAFTRAVPAAISRDAAWLALPEGAAGMVRVSVTIDDDGRIAETVLDPARPRPHLRNLVERTLLLLKSGRFALSRAKGEARQETLRIEATVSEMTPPEGFAPEEPARLGFEPPAAERAGKAFFTLGSGRHIEAKISVDRSRG